MCIVTSRRTTFAVPALMIPCSLMSHRLSKNGSQLCRHQSDGDGDGRSSGSLYAKEYKVHIQETGCWPVLLIM